MRTVFSLVRVDSLRNLFSYTFVFSHPAASNCRNNDTKVHTHAYQGVVMVCGGGGGGDGGGGCKTNVNTNDNVFAL